MRTSLALLLLASSTLCFAQERRPPVVSPEIHADRSVTFRLRAPEAREVSLWGDWPGAGGKLTKGDDGDWSLTVVPLAPELWSYGFIVNGVQMLDPANPAVKPMRSETTSVLDIPGEKPTPCERRADVTYGTVHLHEYDSQSLGRLRRLRVYTPAAYEADAAARLPVLYLLHGSGDNEATWTEHGRAHVILENLIAAGQARPMLLVMPDGHAVIARDQEARRRNTEAFGRDLLESMIPLVESKYRVQSGCDARAISGLSMGGNQTLMTALQHPDQFAWVGGMSAGMRDPQQALPPILERLPHGEAPFRLLWLACGREDRLMEQNRVIHELLAQHGMPHELIETDGAHAWPVWRKHLTLLAPLLFAPEGSAAVPK
jgi:enterochelin esterase family protein